MPKSKNKTYTLYALHVPIFIVFMALLLVAYNLNRQYVSDESTDVLGKGNDKSTKADKSSNNKPDKSNKSDNPNKPDKTSPKPLNKPVNLNKSNKVNNNIGAPNAALHKKKVLEVVEELGEAAVEEEEEGNEEISDEIEEVAEEEENEVDEVSDAIDAVESRSKWKTFLLGTDYKNLGKLRSALAHNTNRIRKLTKTQAKLQIDGSNPGIQEQITELEQERERIRLVIEENENHFSILGWVFRFLSGYTDQNGGDMGGQDDDVDQSTESTESTSSSGL